MAAVTVFAASNPQDYPLLFVQLNVSGSDQATAERMRQQLKNDLEEFDDIKVVEEGAAWNITVIISKGKSTLHPGDDFNFSVLYLRPVQEPSVYEIKDHHLMIGYPNLQGASRRIALFFIETCLGRKVDPKYKRHLHSQHQSGSLTF